MALFNKKTKTEKKPAAAKAAPATRPQAIEHNRMSASSAHEGIFELSHVIVKPRITEKATSHSAQGVYVFDIAVNANKHQVARAVRAIYSVTPSKVRVVNVPSKSKRSARTGKLGTQGGGKKAYVYLKKGETINLS